MKHGLLTVKQQPVAHSLGTSAPGATEIDWLGLCEHVVSHAPLATSTLHGIQHWANVIRTAGMLGHRISGINRRVTVLFGLIHDCCRWNDGRDPDHGLRAAAFARKLQGRFLVLEKDEMDRLATACAGHADGQVTDDLAIGACWDADRLNLVRLGIAPMERYMSLDTTVTMAPSIVSWVTTINLNHTSYNMESLARLCEMHSLNGLPKTSIDVRRC